MLRYRPSSELLLTEANPAGYLGNRLHAWGSKQRNAWLDDMLSGLNAMCVLRVRTYMSFRSQTFACPLPEGTRVPRWRYRGCRAWGSSERWWLYFQKPEPFGAPRNQYCHQSPTAQCSTHNVLMLDHLSDTDIIKRLCHLNTTTVTSRNYSTRTKVQTSRMTIT